MMKMVEFEGAMMTTTEDGMTVYAPRGKITLILGAIVGFYDHAILTESNKIRVMEDYESIKAKLTEVI